MVPEVLQVQYLLVFQCHPGKELQIRLMTEQEQYSSRRQFTALLLFPSARDLVCNFTYHWSSIALHAFYPKMAWSALKPTEWGSNEQYPPGVTKFFFQITVQNQQLEHFLTISFILLQYFIGLLQVLDHPPVQLGPALQTVPMTQHRTMHSWKTA